jgi:hypothetical protein
MKPADERAIAELRTSLALIYLLRYGLAALTVWAFVFGVAVLALRGTAGFSRLDLLWGLASLPIALAPAVRMALRRVPSRDRVRALLDQHGRCGGLLMTAAERPLDGWSAQVPAVRPPQISWRGGRLWALATVACAFAAVGFLVPQSLASLGSSRLDVNREADRLEEQIEILKQQKIISAEKAEELKVELEKLRRDSSGKDPVKTLDGLDHVEKELKKAAEEAAEKSRKKEEEMAKAEALAEAIRGKDHKLNDEQRKEALRKLAELLRKVAEENDLLEKLDPETRKAIEQNKLTTKMLKKLVEALKEAEKGEELKIVKLVKAKLIDPDMLKKGDKDAKDAKDAAAELAAYLKENGLSADAADALTDDGKDGNGDGEGKSKLTFGDESSEEGVTFKEKELPPSKQQDLRNSQLSGVSQGAPNIGKEKAKKGDSGSLDGAKMGGGSAATQTLLPRHKGSVKRYFDRGDKTKK